MNDATKENTNLKKELNRFVNRYFYSKERTLKDLARLYFLLDDFMSFVDKEQTKIGQEMLDNGFEKEYLVSENKKIWLDSDCGILIDELTKAEKMDILIKSNKAVLTAAIEGK